jgi:phage gp46-like protein
MDIALHPTPTGFDLAIDIDDLTSDHSLSTAIIISLFTDLRADDQPEKRGWWGGVIGSHLWLLGREKLTQETLNKAKTYCEAALQWMVTEKIALAVNISVSRLSLESIQISVDVIKPDAVINFQYAYVWDT